MAQAPRLVRTASMGLTPVPAAVCRHTASLNVAGADSQRRLGGRAVAPPHTHTDSVIWRPRPSDARKLPSPTHRTFVCDTGRPASKLAVSAGGSGRGPRWVVVSTRVRWTANPSPSGAVATDLGPCRCRPRPTAPPLAGRRGAGRRPRPPAGGLPRCTRDAPPWLRSGRQPRPLPETTIRVPTCTIGNQRHRAYTVAATMPLRLACVGPSEAVSRRDDR